MTIRSSLQIDPRRRAGAAARPSALCPAERGGRRRQRFPRPAMDEPAGAGLGDRRSSPAAASGACRASSSTSRASSQRGRRLCRRHGRQPELPAGRHRDDRPRRVGQGDLRSEGRDLRQAAADLLLGRAESDRAELSGPRPRHELPLGRLHHDAPNRRRSPTPTSPSSTRRRCFRRRSSPR